MFYSKNQRNQILSVQNYEDVNIWINTFTRPNCLNHYSWNFLKKIAFEVWKDHLDGKKLSRKLNFMHPIFYEMISTPQGNLIVNKNTIRGIN
tara:strand:+ start:115 stop:390 length:276 start_codon:yes stop_codon:yes gene_type:complete